MKIETLKVKTREESGKGPARRLRAEGMAPCILYGHGDPLSISITTAELELLLQRHGGKITVIQLDMTDAPDAGSPALIKDIQRDPRHDGILSVEFQRIRMDERINTSVSLNLTGRPKGLLEGGILDQQIHSIDVECLALNVPEEIEVDVSEMDLGSNIHVRDIPAPEGVIFTTDPDAAVASIQLPRVVEEAEEGEEVEGEVEGEGEGEGDEEKGEES